MRAHAVTTPAVARIATSSPRRLPHVSATFRQGRFGAGRGGRGGVEGSGLGGGGGSLGDFARTFFETLGAGKLIRGRDEGRSDTGSQHTARAAENSGGRGESCAGGKGRARD